jgi:hypothetical protein
MACPRTSWILILGLLLPGCGSHPTPSPSDCPIDTSLMADNVFATACYSGGIAGRDDCYLFRGDGTVERKRQITTPPIELLRFADGASGARSFEEALVATGVCEVAQGCYSCPEVVADNLYQALVMKCNGVVRAYAINSCGGPPDALIAAFVMLNSVQSKLVKQ